MKILVKLKPGGKSDRILETGAIWKAEVSAEAREGKANEALLRLLADHFGISISRLRIISGQSGKTKLIDIK